MLCQNCGENEANVRYTQVINGVKKQISLCEKCAKELGIGTFQFNMPIHFSDFLGDFFGDYDTELLPNFVKKSNNLCNTCGEDYNEFIKTGFLGCPECYDMFEDKLDPILKKLQGNVQHVGRGISNRLEKSSIRSKNEKIDEKEKANNKVKSEEDKLEELNEKLKLAIKEERYEDAAKIRDEIKNIKG